MKIANEVIVSDMKTSRLAVALIVLAVVVAAGLASRANSARHNRTMLRDFATESDEIIKDVQKDYRVEGSAEKARRTQDSLGRTASRLNGDPAKAFRAGERLMDSMQFQIVAYEKSYSAFLSQGGLSPASLTSDEVIGKRMALLKTFANANKNYKEFLEGVENKFRAELSKEAFPPSRLNETVRAFRETGNIDAQLAIRVTDAELCTTMESYLLLLKNEWGKWKVDQARHVVFENDRAADAFNDYWNQMNDMASRQTELQKRVLRARERASGTLKPSILGTQ